MKSRFDTIRVVALAGGVGGAKLALGLHTLLSPQNLAICVNTGDDFTHFGLKICPDLDTVCYALAGWSDFVRGWGVQDETWNVQEQLGILGAPTWFSLGDRDLALHLERTRLLSEGINLTAVTAKLVEKLGVEACVLPMTNQPAPTYIALQSGGLLGFQEYFVREHCQPEVAAIVFPPAHTLQTTNEIIERLSAADLVIICPSNPFLSIDPILNVPPIHELIQANPVIAVSPIINGAAIKGPAAKLLSELGYEVSAAAVLSHYAQLLDAFIYDETEFTAMPASGLVRNARGKGIIMSKTNTIMKEASQKTDLAKHVLDMGLRLLGH